LIRISPARALPLLCVLLASACTQTEMPPVKVELPITSSIDYVDDVSPVLDRRCVVCHSCYNAACQLKLSSIEGIERGGSKAPVYDGSRLKTQAPTRLFIDAHSTLQWRDKGFHSVTDRQRTKSGEFDPDDTSTATSTATSTEISNASLMLHLLDAKRRQPVSQGEYHPEATDLTCAANPQELGKFLADHPKRGMPFGFPQISESEFATLASWLVQGTPGPDAEARRTLYDPSPSAKSEIAKWESFLNQEDAKHAMTARYLYEHFFLAHLRFSDSEPLEFFEVVRSTTAPGSPISVIATIRPYDDPGVATFYYRFRKIHSTIVYKTHMVVEIDDKTLTRLDESFIDSPWLEEPHWVEPDDVEGANPFLVYKQIPPIVRYQFLLDNVEYILRTFIRGPVCKGQIALNVIHDHFWVTLLDPAADLTVQHPEFLVEQASNLRLPNEQGSSKRLVQAFSDQYRERYSRFYRAKLALYRENDPKGFGLEAIWKGNRAEDAPLLTIYRHFDSASVHKGALGDLPRTLWVIDYSQLERIYYSLVAGFDVFGNLSHQANVRRYMDYLRIEGELNFLDFMPRADRLEMMQSWYLGVRSFENVDAATVEGMRETSVPYLTEEPKREFAERLVEDFFLPATEITFDSINYRDSDRQVTMPKTFGTHEDILDAFRALTAPGTGFIAHANGSDVNLFYVRVRNYMGTDRYFTMVINRWHDNVNSMFGEDSRLDPSKDTIDFLPSSVGAYPNYFFEVDGEKLPVFFDMLENFDGSEEYIAKFLEFGVNRADDDFWESYDRFQAVLDQSDPLHTGLYDLNRYHPVALSPGERPR
jgi:hypothetical protein